MLKRLILSLALGIVLLPLSASAVTVTTDLQGELIKGSQPAVYFYGENGKRYVFPNDKIFFTWYSDFTSVRTVTDEELAAIPIGGNVTYRPGTKLIKIMTDPRVYAVSGNGILRWITSEQLARAIYGEDWAKQVQDIPDSFFGDYSVGNSITSESVYQPESERYAYQTVSRVISPTETSSTTGTAGEHTIVLSSAGGKNFTWTDTAVSPMGYKLVWSKNANPTYPTRDGDRYVYYGNSSDKAGSLSGALETGATYYVRVCEYLGGRCGAYSNEVTITGTDAVTSGTSNTSSDHVIVLRSAGGKSFTWSDTAVSPLGYKLVWSKVANPTYPTRDSDHYAYYGESSTKSGSVSGSLESGARYYVRVCEYLGGHCGAYSNEVTITGTDAVSTDDGSDEETSAGTPHAIVLASAGGKAFTWTDNTTSPNGYKLVWSKVANPTYPTRDSDSYAYYSESGTRSGSISDVESGATYYVRVCNYVNGACGSYSNQVQVTISGTSTGETSNTTSNHVIVLSSAGGKNFTWTDTAVSSMGYKLVWGKVANPMYPTRDSDHYVYYGESSTKSGSISDLESGATYYVRVCEYLGGRCGAYSNQVTITAPATE